MPLTEAERAFLEEPPSTVDSQHQVLEHNPSDKFRIGKWTIVALILNRTIGSGIFLTPNKILAGTGCVGGALCLWALGAFLSFCGLYVWLECGLSMPQRVVRGESEPRGVPRSGGEKNFLEFMFASPKYRTTCCFAIMFVLLYNLSGNALSFGIQVMIASNRYRPQDDLPNPPPPHQGITIAIAIVALTAAILLHIFSRRGGIFVNNAFAIIKVLILVVVICLGIAKACGKFGGNDDIPYSNFTKDVFTTRRTDVASWSNSLVFCMYTYSGFEQPFYVLAETKSPRRYFPKYTVIAMITATVLFMLVNVTYLLVVPKQFAIDNMEIDLATMFLDRLFGQNDDRATRALAALIAFSILGNIVVMTFTASRVKQEIAKEGIFFRFSLAIATSHTTPYGLLKKARSQGRIADEHVEQSPIAAFCLHWFTSILLILVTIPIKDVRIAYSVLVSLYSYTIILLSGCWVSIGLIMVKLRKSTYNWQNRRRYRPWISPVHVIVYGSTCAFLLVAAFTPPGDGSPYSYEITKFKWYIVPTIGLSAPLWGFIWYLGLLAYQRSTRRYLHVERTPYWIKDPYCPGEYVQMAEIIDHTMRPRPRGDFEASEGFADDRQSIASNSDDAVALGRPDRFNWFNLRRNKTPQVQVFTANFDNDSSDDRVCH